MNLSQSEMPTKSINYLILALIVGLAIVYQAFNHFVQRPDDQYDIFELLLSTSYVVASIAAFIVAKRYWRSEIFGKTYFALALAYLVYFVGDEIFFYYTNVMHVEAFPSFADVFYFVFYPFAGYHLMKNSTYFKRKFEFKIKLELMVVPIVIAIAYAIIAYDSLGEANFDYYYGVVFVAADAILLGFALVGAQTFRQSILGPVWGLIVLGIIFYTVADIWYYYLELFGQYSDSHIVNMFWLLNTMLVTYALYKHQKTI